MNLSANPPSISIPSLRLSAGLAKEMDEIAQYCVDTFGDVENRDFALIARSLAFELLPKELIEEVREMYYREILLQEGKCALLIENLCTLNLGNTPTSWQTKTKKQAAETRKVAFLMMLIKSLYWHIIAFKEQRTGIKCHDIIPQEGDEYKQIGTGSHAELYLHTEDVPLVYSADVIGLFTMRNLEKAESTLCFSEDLELPAHIREILRAKQFIFPPDPNILKRKNVTYDTRKKPIFFGNRQFPSVQVAPIDIFDNNVELDKEAMEALITLNDEVNRKAISFAMKQGDLLLFSNHRCLHGRGKFKPSYSSGQKRWVLRMMAAEGLVKSVKYREAANPWLITESCTRPIC